MKKWIILSLCVYSFIISSNTVSAETDFKPKFSAAITESYDDNVSFADQGRSSDFITRLRLMLDLMQEGRTHQFKVQGNVTQNVFADNSDFNNTALGLDLYFNKELSRFERISATNKLTRAEEPRSFEDDFGRASGRYSYVRNAMNFAYTKDISKQSSYRISYGNQLYEVSRDNLADSFMNKLSVEWIYAIDSVNTVTAEYEFETRGYSPGGRSNKHTVASLYRHYFTQVLFIETRGGLSFIDAVVGDDILVEPSILVRLRNNFSDTESVSITFRRSASASTFSADVFESWRLSLDFIKQIQERLAFRSSVFIGNGEFDSTSIEDKQYGFDTRFIYDLSERAEASIGYNYSQVDSNSSTRDYRRNLFDIGMSFSF